MTEDAIPSNRTPGAKLLIALLLGAVLAVPLFAVYLLVWDRQSQSATASQSITQGWGGPQRLAGPLLVIPFMVDTSETVTENGRATQRTAPQARELVIAPDQVDLATDIAPEHRRRSIYDAVVYTARTSGTAHSACPRTWRGSASRPIGSSSIAPSCASACPIRADWPVRRRT